MNNKIPLLIIILLFIFEYPGFRDSFGYKKHSNLLSERTVPLNVKKLMKHYPQITGYKDNKLIFSDNSTLLYDDSLKNKKFSQLLENPDIEDQFNQEYPLSVITGKIAKNQDPGRFRNDSFFRKIYGNSSESVRKNLVTVKWCPKLIGKNILITKINGVADKVKLLSKELDQFPQYKTYLENISTFYWRHISGTKRLSAHSFGIAIDISVKFSNYWQWDCKCSDENRDLKYKNRVPAELVKIFEKYGFIWGGKWYHYDTMHFEYRPELLE